jgi:hypothetical protein
MILLESVHRYRLKLKSMNNASYVSYVGATAPPLTAHKVYRRATFSLIVVIWRAPLLSGLLMTQHHRDSTVGE